MCDGSPNGMISPYQADRTVKGVRTMMQILSLPILAMKAIAKFFEPTPVISFVDAEKIRLQYGR